MTIVERAKQIMFEAGVRASAYDRESDEGQSAIGSVRAAADDEVCALPGVTIDWTPDADFSGDDMGAWFQNGLDYGLKC